MLAQGAKLPLFCPDRPGADPACAFAENAGRCGPYASRTRLCVLDAEERAELLGRP